MSSNWCMWCKYHPNNWNGLLSVPASELWSIGQQHQFVERILSGELKEPKDKKGIVDSPLIDFFQPGNYIFPQLHFKIGTVNNVLDGLRAFTEEEVEVLSEPEKEARNLKIIADVSYTKARGKAEVFNTTGGSVELKLFRIERVRLNQSLKGRNLTQEDREALLAQRQEIDDEIESLTQEQKRLKADASAKRKAFMEASKVLKELQAKKTKLDKPTIATIENILLKYEISPARYHGGKLNGVDCRELMYKSVPIFEEIEQLLLSIGHPQRCSSHTIRQQCKVY